MKKLSSKLRKTIYDFNLIEKGDKIAIGLSGGKDSIALLYLLSDFQKYSSIDFNLIAITLNTDKDNKLEHLKVLCDKLDVEYHIINSDIKEIVFDIRKEKNPCSLCAKMRRGALNENAKLLGCNKVALGHHKNDAIETLLMAMLYEGRINCFTPKTYLSRMDINIIRPMVYISEREIISFSEKYNFPIVKNPCPADGYTKRQYFKDLICNLEKDIPNIEDRLLGCLLNEAQLKIWHKEN